MLMDAEGRTYIHFPGNFATMFPRKDQLTFGTVLYFTLFHLGVNAVAESNIQHMQSIQDIFRMNVHIITHNAPTVCLKPQEAQYSFFFSESLPEKKLTASLETFWSGPQWFKLGN